MSSAAGGVSTVVLGMRGSFTVWGPKRAQSGRPARPREEAARYADTRRAEGDDPVTRRPFGMQGGRV
ncbi:hypothetical protein GCM10010266_07090 [Streptomyces griseomycini]|nr:hypothetical protein GCM10010266_07090 [Streptomyces griseomycini]